MNAEIYPNQSCCAYLGDSTQLTYLRARFYASGNGRFLTRDTWTGDENIPMSYNRWLYVYAQPINNADPTGLEAFYDTFAEFRDDYHSIHNKNAVRWTAQERYIVNQALIKIAIAYAKTYNAEAEKRGLFINCPPDLNYGVYGYEVYINPATPMLDPFTAFNRIHNNGQKLIIYKHTGNAPEAYGDAWGTGLNERQLDIYARGHFDRAIDYLTGYGKADFSVGVDNYKRFIVHEMGHVFDHTVNKRLGIYPRNFVKGDLAKGSYTIENGFCGPKLGYSRDNPYVGWQWRFTNDVGEYFADMFVGWTYNCWEKNDDDQLTVLGQARSNFMNQHMQEWIYSLISGHSGVSAGEK